MEVTTGYYMNLFEYGGNDVFLIFNEANSEPTAEEVEALKAVVETTLKNNHEVDRDGLRTLFKDAVENTDCECTQFGFQIILKAVR